MRHVASDDLSRTPPVEVRRLLRREVGFGCPVTDCGNPYLEYHHFDPPWEQEQHHDPARMIALCATHHAKASAWTVDQFRKLKAVPFDRPDVRGRFEWMREDVLAVVGGSFFYETPNMVVFHGEPMIWFERDQQRRLLLNLRVLTASGLPRTQLENNDWIIRGDPIEVDSPPNGSRLRVGMKTATTFLSGSASGQIRLRSSPFTREPLIWVRTCVSLLSPQKSRSTSGARISSSVQPQPGSRECRSPAQSSRTAVPDSFSGRRTGRP